jgi:hypothetical protein
MLGNGVTAALARVVGRLGTELSASSPTSAAVAGGLAYLALRVVGPVGTGASDGRDTPV